MFFGIQAFFLHTSSSYFLLSIVPFHSRVSGFCIFLIFLPCPVGSFYSSIFIIL